MGFIQSWAKSFVLQLLNHETKTEKKRDQRPVQKLWTLLLFDITDPGLVTIF